MSPPTHANSDTHRIFIVAGEASGDLHASNLVKQVKQLDPHASFYGMGGTLMRQAGVKIIVDSTDLAIIGGVEVVRHLFTICKAMRKIKRELTLNPPHLLILIDYPGFNLWLAKIAKKLGIKILYYISPQIWAWHQSRVKKIRKYVAMMAVLFPFEVAFYEKFHVPVTLVRHPLLDIVKPTMEKSSAQTFFNLNPHATTIGLFPGSRKNEISRLLPVMLQAATLLHAQYPQSQFVLPLASSLHEDEVKPYLQKSSLNITIVKNLTYDAASVCDAIMATSGTVTLEIALLGIPMVITYKLATITYWIIRQLIKIPYIGLCNIVAEKPVVPELIQHTANAQNIAAAITNILERPHYRAAMVKDLQQTRHKLEAGGNARKIADVVLEMLCLYNR